MVKGDNGHLGVKVSKVVADLDQKRRGEHLRRAN
jgi:hypothetical protein